MVKENAGVQTCKKWRQWGQISGPKNIAVIEEMCVGGKCVRMRQVGSSMLSS